MDGDEEIFKAILEPLIVDTVTEGLKKQWIDGDDAEVEEIFKAILEPLIVDTVTEGLKKQWIDGDDAIDDAEVEELPDPVSSPLNQNCK
jgi:hypothetical protein